MDNSSDYLAWYEQCFDSQIAVPFSVEGLTTAVHRVKKAMWENDFTAKLLPLYQGLHRILAKLLNEYSKQIQHHFVVVVPVADRPTHLQACLHSLLSLCRLYEYGGKENGFFSKVLVVVADDSAQVRNQEAHQALLSDFTAQGLRCQYFGIPQQLALIRKLPPTLTEQMSGIIGQVDPANFSHKGASITRNITYLKLRELQHEITNPLFYFIDSDQEFQLPIKSADGVGNYYAVNFFYELNGLFNQSHIQVVTGKVVGDPPVSPAVMAANFLDDVDGFLEEMADYEARQTCQFHQPSTISATDAAYHDMADLFGFNSQIQRFRYPCPLTSFHDNRAAFQAFAQGLNRFFDGEHQTRKTTYEYSSAHLSLTSARTIYTGNYIFRSQALAYFIPFAPLKLRMAGPVMGRLLRSWLGDGFVSVNLPMLHKRTLAESGCSECRPGIDHIDQLIDFTGEFERQFFGDVMLFAIESLIARGYPDQPLQRSDFEQVFHDQVQRLLQRYLEKRSVLELKLRETQQRFANVCAWWHKEDSLSVARDEYDRFFTNLAHNFSSTAKGYGLISAKDHQQQRVEAMIEAVEHYGEELKIWKQWC
jgi:hypothetical protein